MHNVETKNKRKRCISPALIFVHHNSENPPRVQWYPDLCSNSWLKPPAIGDTSDIRQILQGTPTERTFCNSSQTKRGLYYSRYFYEVQTFLPHWRTEHSYWQHRPVILYVHFICMPPAFNTFSFSNSLSVKRQTSGLGAGPSYEGLFMSNCGKIKACQQQTGVKTLSIKGVW